jgi:hypothetical protein
MRPRLDRQSIDGRSWYFKGIDGAGKPQEVQVYLLDSERYVVVIDNRCVPFRDWATLAEAQEAAQEILDLRVEHSRWMHGLLNRLAHPLENVQRHHG